MTTSERQSAPANIVLITLDCVRPESLSWYDEQFQWWRRVPRSAATPNIDRLAAEGVAYDQAVCQAPFTPASHASMLTGQNPYDHGIRRIIGQTLADGATTIAERLSDAGFETGAFIGAHALRSEYGLDAGFDIYDETFETAATNWELGSRRPCEEVVDNALDWFDAGSPDPSFLFLHFFDAHDGTLPNDDDGPLINAGRRLARPIDERLGRPLEVRKGYGRRFQLRQATRIDRQVGRVLSALEETGTLAETMFFVLADHGDSFGEHGEFNHREFLFDTTVRIPFVFRPDRAAQTVPVERGAVVRSVDIYPTICARLGLDPDQTAGESLFSPRDSDAIAYCETQFEEPGTDFQEVRHSYEGLRSRRWKFIRDRRTGATELYDLRRDPHEQHNVSEAHPDVVRRFQAELRERPGTDSVGTAAMDDAEWGSLSDQLEGLGYL